MGLSTAARSQRMFSKMSQIMSAVLLGRIIRHLRRVLFDHAIADVLCHV